MIAILTRPITAVLTLTLAVVAAVGMGLLMSLRLAVIATFDGHLDTTEQHRIEQTTWAGVWVILRRVPGLKVD